MQIIKKTISSDIQTLKDIKNHFDFIRFLKHGIRFRGSYHAVASKTTQTERPGKATSGFILLVAMETVGDMQYSYAFAYTYGSSIFVPENVSQLSLAFTSTGLGNYEPMHFQDVCFATIYSENRVGQSGRLWVKAHATASSAANELNIIVR